MKNLIKYRITIPALFAAAIIFSSCEDWTEQESLTIKQANIAEQNPELYAQYLTNLKAYKNSDHKTSYAWFDNSIKTATSPAHHLASIPDSIDIVVLMHPDSLSDQEIAEMKSIRENKGTKIIYNISYPDIEKLYDATVAAELDKAATGAVKDPSIAIESPTQKAGFTDFLNTRVDNALAIDDKYNYDGISVRYDSKSTVYMADTIKEKYLGYQQAFFGKISLWITSHKDKMFVYEGKPQYLADKAILHSSKYIVLRTEDAAALNDLTLSARMAIADGVPTDRFVVCVSTYPLDATDLKTGRFFDSEGKSLSALSQAAVWVSMPEPDFTKAGLGIYNIQNDYYNTSLIFKYTREAIVTMNPSPKN
jgi:hypothetical protein